MLGEMACLGSAIAPSFEARAYARPRNDSIVHVSLSASIHEHDGLAAVEDHAILQMMPHGARQHAALDVAALAHEIFRRVAMADALDVLVDDRALVEIAR